MGKVAAHASLSENLDFRLFMSLLFIAIGIVLAFDIRGFASKAWDENTGVTSWGRKLKATGTIPNILIPMGWVFLLVGLIVFIVSVPSMISG